MRDLFCIAITLTAALAAGIFTGRRTMGTPTILEYHGGIFDGDVREGRHAWSLEWREHPDYPGTIFVYKQLSRGDVQSYGDYRVCRLHYVNKRPASSVAVLTEEEIANQWKD